MDESSLPIRQLVEECLSKIGAFQSLGEDRFAIKQGSTFVLVDVIASDDKTMVRCTAQVVKVPELSAELAKDLLIRNSALRFGAFAFDPALCMVIYSHALPGDDALSLDALQSILYDVALISDQMDEGLAAKYDGQTMRDLII